MKKLLFFSDYYNHDDLKFFSKNFDVIFIPTNSNIEKNVKSDFNIDYGFSEYLKRESKFKIWFEEMFYLDLLFFEEVNKTKFSFNKKNSWHIKAKKLKDWIYEHYLSFDNENIFLGSYWEEAGSLGISYLKKDDNTNIIFKVKSNLEERIYLPYRKKIFRNIKKFYVVSEYERDLLFKKYPKYINKIELIKSR